MSGAPHETFESRMLPILKRNCLDCHRPTSGMPAPDLSDFWAVRKVAKVDTGILLLSLVRRSHIHLFGIGLVLVGGGDDIPSGEVVGEAEGSAAGTAIYRHSGGYPRLVPDLLGSALCAHDGDCWCGN